MGSTYTPHRTLLRRESIPPPVHKRRIRGSTLGALATALAAALAGCAVQEPVPDIALTPQRVSADVWYFEGGTGMALRENQGFMSNAGFVLTPQGVVVFDTLATPALAESMLAAIRRITDLPVRHVILSHYHADHIYGAQVFKAAGAQIWARSEGRQYLASDLARERLAQRRSELSPWVDENTQLVAADHWLDFPDDQPLGFELGGRRFELLDGGDSHTPGDLMLRVPDQGVLFAGDLFFTGRLPFVVDGNTREWLGALERMDRSRAGVVIPGHGPVSRQVASDLRLTREYLEFLRARMRTAVDQMQTFDEAYASIDWSRFADQPTFEQANRRNAYSVYLEMEAEALAETSGP